MQTGCDPARVGLCVVVIYTVARAGYVDVCVVVVVVVVVPSVESWSGLLVSRRLLAP